MTELPPGQVEKAGDVYMPDAKGSLVPIENVKMQHRVQDQTVRQIFAAAQLQAAALRAFKAKAFDDVDALQQLLEQEYKAKTGGAKGNLTLYSYDGLIRIQVQISDLIKFGPELQVAKTLLDECTGDWLVGSRSELRVIVMSAFRVDKEGQLNGGALLGLRRYEIDDERWVRAMKAIADSIQVIGSKRYIRFAHRASPKAPWVEVSLNVATAEVGDSQPA